MNQIQKLEGLLNQALGDLEVERAMRRRDDQIIAKLADRVLEAERDVQTLKNVLWPNDPYADAVQRRIADAAKALFEKKAGKMADLPRDCEVCGQRVPLGSVVCSLDCADAPRKPVDFNPESAHGAADGFGGSDFTP